MPLFRTRHGFTIPEIVTVVAIISILTLIGTGVYIQFVQSGRDSARIQSLDSFKTAIELYYQKYRHYPPACGTDDLGYQYYRFDCSNGQYAAGDLRFSNSLQYLLADNGLLDPGNPEKSLYYSDSISTRDWTDPRSKYLAALPSSEKFNCRYVIEKTSQSDAQNCPMPATYKEIQKYYLHCALEAKFQESSNASDGGRDRDEDIYEAASSPWLGCLFYAGT